MSVSTARKGSRIVDRPEYASKFSPLTARRDTTVAVAVQAMKSKNYGCIVITNGSGQVEGIVTERDIMFKLVAENRDPQTVVLSDIMTSDIRMAKETDNVLDWLRIMSNERFRRLPVVDSEGRLQALLTQADISQVACRLTSRSPDFARWASVFRPERCLSSRKRPKSGGSSLEPAAFWPGRAAFPRGRRTCPAAFVQLGHGSWSCA